MRSAGLVAVLLVLLAGVAVCDVYLQGCGVKGSNDRLDETSTNRNNANRLFDSQNNAKGGYCVHPKMHFFVGSYMPIEWTNQHGCGGNPNVHCDIVLQYMCADSPKEIRNGRTTQTIPNDQNTYQDKVQDNDPDDDRLDPQELDDNEEAYEYGMHESFEYYQKCANRERNLGLFTADRNVGQRARNTRQNNGGTRHGFECPEERDYYPYWHPSPWKDIAVLTDTPSRCEFYRENSQNVKDTNECSIDTYNNRKECEDNGGDWETVSAHNIDPPECRQAPWSRDNHLGNSFGSQATSMYNWTIPDDVNEFCVLRIRYNISSGDYDGWSVDSESNGADDSPVVNDPIVEVSDRNLSLAINTAQFGRTFQDRSHTFEIRERPAWLPLVTRVYNVNVRGKRGNIVQTYPATEYDFCPTELEVRNGDYLHFQWSGCDSNPQGNDGEGTRGTDRSNLVEMKSRTPNKPHSSASFFDGGDQRRFAYVKQDNCPTLEELENDPNNNNQDDIDRAEDNCMKLNKAPRYFDGGLVRVHHTEGEYSFMSTRNNNFTNRSQKMSIVVLPFLAAWAIVLIVLGAGLSVAGLGIAGVAVGAKVFPASAMGQCWYRLA